MSLADFALRLATVQSVIQGNTFAGQNVKDSPVSPVDHVFTGDTEAISSQTLVAVYTNLSVGKSKDSDLLVMDRDIELMLQMYVPHETEVGGNENVGPIKGSDAGGRLFVDLLSRQILRVFLYDTTPWANLRRKIMFKTEELRTQSYGLQTDTKMDVSAREMLFKCDVISDPPFGRPLEGVWLEFVTLVEATPAIAALGPLLRSEIETPSGADWQGIMADIGVGEHAVRGIGLSLALVAPSEDPPELVEIQIDNEDGGGILIEEPIP